MASSTSLLLATTSLPIASTAASYITRARHIALKFDGDLFRLYAISAQAKMPPRIIKSTHLLRITLMLSPPGVGGDFKAYRGGPGGRQMRNAIGWADPAGAVCVWPVRRRRRSLPPMSCRSSGYPGGGPYKRNDALKFALSTRPHGRREGAGHCLVLRSGGR